MIDVEDFGPDPGLWVSFKIQVLSNQKCSQERSELVDSDNNTKATFILRKYEGLWSHLCFCPFCQLLWSIQIKTWNFGRDKIPGLTVFYGSPFQKKHIIAYMYVPANFKLDIYQERV